MSTDHAGGVVVVGAGHAGVQVAFGLRAGGWDGAVTLLDTDRRVPYERPPLSKELLADGGPELAPPLRKAELYPAKQIVRVPGVEVARLDRDRRVAVDAEGAEYGYQHLVLCNGSRVRRLDVPGGNLPGVHYLKSHVDATRLRTALQPGRRVVVVGAGYIGLEVAAAAAKRGCEVTVLEFNDRVMARVTGETVSRYFEHLHQLHGADVRLGVSVTGVEGDDIATGVVLSTGETVPADVVVVGVGVVPNDELARASGIDCHDGVLVDERALTSDPAVSAAGDVARWWSHGELPSRRLECIQNATHGAKRVVAHLLGRPAGEPEVPWFWTVQHGVRLQTAGLWDPADEVVLRGSAATGSFSVLYLRHGVLAAIDTINAVQDFLPGKKLIAAGLPIDPARAADPTIKLSASVRELAHA
ncbi:NAD(P)/FAD-dependent oxidoreductase [Georgenia subflava]|uniref:Pyridine nucleotide-disulfide oxidoreductase n=1 Tax=Georgenia subflava TaxID=1622177 RepID=A0A6N7EHD0_9MICO|nr:FAD-dependent oxidoreductase [Georgenia subflava]MPV35556.1 hypothetical protein [Georgenia subflava]